LAIFIGVWLQFANKIEHGGKEWYT
jgi:hypothetical protein